MELDLERQAAGRSEIEIEGSCILADRSTGPASVVVSGSLTVDNLDSRFLITGSVEAAGETQCDRCLATYRLIYDVPVEITVLRDVESSEGEGDTWVIQQRIGVVDLSSTVREAAILAFPAKRVCRPQCRGLCAQCGGNLNEVDCDCLNNDVDPRWADLPDG